MKFGTLLLVSLFVTASAFGQGANQPPSQPTTAAAPTPAAEPQKEPPAALFRSGIDLVALSVVVTDGKQNFVQGLSVDQFAVYEDGVRQDVSFFASGDVPLDLAILLDTSASMTDKISTAQQAAVGFASTLRPIDRLLVVDIKDTSQILAPLSSDLAAAKAAILSTTPKGGTALYNGLYLTLKELARQRRGAGEVRRQALVVLSDGDDTASLMSFEDVMDLAKQSGISIYTIMLKPKWPTRQTVTTGQRYFSQSEFAMKALAQETGARAFFPADISELAGVYSSIADELASHYALGYTSKNARRDGSYRRVVVRVTEPAGVQTRTRAGYLAARVERAAN